MRVVQMMKQKPIKPCIIMSVDASSTAIALSIFEQKKEHAYLVETAKINLNNFSMNTKFNIISNFFPKYFSKYKINYVFVEQPIYIQNPATSRILSQISGHILGVCLNYCDNVHEVTIGNWKSYIGYKNVSKKEKELWTEQFGQSEAKKIAAKERKQRTIDIVHKKIDGIDHIIDNDICDSIGIGLYALETIRKEDFDGS